MAMLSLKNLVAPVSNTVHLVSIVFVVLLFGFWRWSGGEISVSRSSRSAPAASERRAPAEDDFENRRNAAPARVPQRGVIAIPDEAADDLLGSMLGSGSETRAPARKNADTGANSKPRSSSALEDIERSLGLK